MSIKVRSVSVESIALAAACAFSLAGCLGDPDTEPTAEAISTTAAALRSKGNVRERIDPAGLLESASSNGFGAAATNGFFANLGTNGRTCGSCHVIEDGWTITPAHARGLAADDALFTPNDGSDCPPTSAAQGPCKELSTELTSYGLIRVQIGVPAGADFWLVSATNPAGCALAPASPDVRSELFLYRRPLPSTNLVFDTTIMWDGRETLQKVTNAAGFQDQGPWLFDLNDQANAATMGHAQGASIAGTPAQADIVAFETNLYTAQSRFGFFEPLDAKGAHGGAQYLASVVAPAFAVGVNDPLQPGFSSAAFTVFAAWEPASPGYDSLDPIQKAIGRGEALFNQTTFTIHDVPGLNSTPDDPLYNPNDPLAGQDIEGGCAVCHNSPNVGNHSSSLQINIGVTMAQPVNNDGSPNNRLDVAHLPVYTLTEGTAQVNVTDPGRALITGHWTDVGKTKGPILRGLAGRAPYFHNGSAKDLTTVVRFYNDRFAIGLSDRQVRDLVAFLNAL